MRHKVSNLVPVHARQAKLEQPIPAVALIDYEKDDVYLFKFLLKILLVV